MTVTAVEFDPFSDEYFDDPTDVYRRLRDEAPVYFSERYGFYALSRFADVVAAHRDWHGFSSEHGIDLSSLTKDPELIRSLGMIIMMDPPAHERFRALVSRVFTPRAVTALEPMIREVITGLLDPLVGEPGFDVVQDFSAPFPVEVISRMLGVPEGERQKIREWIDLSLHRHPGEVDPTPEGQAAMLELAGYFSELTAEKRAHPADDMLSRLTQVTVDRGDGEETGLDDREISGFAGAHRRCRRRDGHEARRQRGLPVRRPPRPVADGPRRPGAPPRRGRGDPADAAAVAVPGTVLGRGPHLRGRHDPGRLPRAPPHRCGDARPACVRAARRLRHRPAAAVAVGFGHGVHSCLGAALARMESRIAIEEIAARWERLEVDGAGLRRVNMSNVAGYSNVPVTAVR